MIISASKWQQILLDYWEDFWSQPEVKDAEWVVNLAESIEGNNRRQSGRHLMTADLNLQVQAALELLRPRVDEKKYLSFSGSNYHDALEVDLEGEIAEQLGGQFYGVIKSLQFGDKIINAAHDSGSALIYKSTQLDRLSLFYDAVEGGSNKVHAKFDYHIDLVLRGHCHQYFEIANESRRAVLCPCWKFWHPIGIWGAKNHPRTQPSIGAVVVEVGRTVTVKPFLYPIQHIYDTLIQAA